MFSVRRYVMDVDVLRSAKEKIDAAIEKSIDEGTDQARRELIAVFTHISSAAERCAEHQSNLLPPESLKGR